MNRGCLFRIICVSIVCVLLLPFCASAQEKLRIGLSSVSATSGSIWAAQEKGLFKKYGADVEVIVIGGGGARVVSALLAGDIHFSVGGGEGSIRSQIKGVDTVIIAPHLRRVCSELWRGRKSKRIRNYAENESQ